MVFSKFKKKTRRVATEIKKFEKRDLAQAVIGVGVMVDFISRIMSVLADSWACWCGLPIDEKTSNYLACYL
ncbi:TPA: tellurite resistance TerB family protein [Escherichia coli]|nr:tellurite resistance TerB family protein [Escherichia coli]HCN8133424.1 tellurite resistance TerB family protein [Escherichia coli]